jgi:hypothetical protein
MAAKPSTPTTKRARSPKLKIKAPRTELQRDRAASVRRTNSPIGFVPSASWLPPDVLKGLWSAIGGVVRLGCRPS